MYKFYVFGRGVNSLVCIYQDGIGFSSLGFMSVGDLISELCALECCISSVSVHCQKGPFYVALLALYEKNVHVFS